MRAGLLQELKAKGRLQRVTLPALKAAGAASFCWLGAGEQVFVCVLLLLLARRRGVPALPTTCAVTRLAAVFPGSPGHFVISFVPAPLSANA